jgi:putative endonuclease
MNEYWVYIMSNVSKTLYIGITNNLQRRIQEHKLGMTPGFVEQYNIKKLVHMESTNDIYSALNREKQLKGWSRSKKINLIESSNPNWNDLSDKWTRTEILRYAQNDK